MLAILWSNLCGPGFSGSGAINNCSPSCLNPKHFSLPHFLSEILLPSPSPSSNLNFLCPNSHGDIYETDAKENLRTIMDKRRVSRYDYDHRMLVEEKKVQVCYLKGKEDG